ncbi:extracellular solute-binding protein [Xylanimonas ulmi]|uniref:Carbohydrate ABC transporter substrate-binding protein (CUT1 family) n=1 Tax=Xylanimonas ulmi TaxID=228973 RepID=A0A4Q7M5P9_9MICO|nr:extracellular solute-binding protein [Xylanibacterium ulmi]RZS62974.1 carbohydrate ABC transporter substrate-binding protein (CUT1 family) [Xylanibacterium ulmi]
MRKIRRGSAALASVATLALALTACSSGGDDNASPNETGGTSEATIDDAHSVGAMDDFAAGTTFKATEPVDFSLMYRDHPNYPVKDDWSILQHLDSDHNVTFTRTDVPLADWDNKKSLLIGSGDFPEIVPVTYAGQETQFVASGALLPVSDYLQYMPNFEQKVKDWGIQAELDTHKQEDGKLYILPGLREVPDVQYSVLINEEMWEKAGITEDPATWDDFAEDLKKVKDANPEIKYAFSDRWNQTPSPLGAFLQMTAPNFKTEAGWDQAAMTFDQDAKKFEVAGTSANYKDLVTYVSGLVSDGTLDPEITQTDDQAIQKFITGQSATISGNTQYSTDIGAKLADAGKSDLKMRLLTLPAGPKGDNLRGSQLTSGVMISAKAKDDPHFKALLQYIDWQYFSDEGLEFAQWGVEGETFQKGSDGARTLLPGIDWNGINPDAGDNPKLLNTDFGYSNGVFMLANGSTRDLVQSVMAQDTKDWVNSILDRKTLLPVKPSAGLNEAELEQTSLLETQVKDAVNTATAEFITGKKSLSDWDAYVAQIDGLGGSQLTELYNTAYQRSQG